MQTLVGDALVLKTIPYSALFMLWLFIVYAITSSDSLSSDFFHFINMIYRKFECLVGEIPNWSKKDVFELVNLEQNIKNLVLI